MPTAGVDEWDGSRSGADPRPLCALVLGLSVSLSIVLARRLAFAMTVLTLTVAPACAAVPSPATIATFSVSGERFSIMVRDSVLLGQLRSWERGEPGPRIPNGRIVRGSGVNDHNRPWSWHLDPSDIVLADVAIEFCDGTPSDVEARLDEFLSIGRYCPWAAELVDLQPQRAVRGGIWRHAPVSSVLGFLGSPLQSARHPVMFLGLQQM